jgi:hypothetical protein
MAWGVQKGRRWLQVARSAGGPPLGSSLGETFGSPWPPLAIRPWSHLPRSIADGFHRSVRHSIYAGFFEVLGGTAPHGDLGPDGT